MGFQVYNSQGQELQNLTGTAGGDLTGTYPNPTLITGLGKTRVASATTDTISSTTSSTYADITSLSVSITPSTSSKKVLVLFTVNLGFTDNQDIGLQLVRGSTALGLGLYGTQTLLLNAAQNINGYWSDIRPMSYSYLDSPATTSSTTYKVQFKKAGGSGTTYVNRRGYDASYGTTSTITVVEVDAA